MKHDPQNAELKEGLMRCVDAINKVNGGAVCVCASDVCT
jgi:hypothetical protein